MLEQKIRNKIPFSTLNVGTAHALFIFLVVCEILSAEVPRPRGVSLSRASLYDPQNDFLCFDGSLTVRFGQVNDDYCDCPDGSDEPGTAACPNGVFHCTNAGYRPMNIYTNRVNDGVCDCCDGSDEYAGHVQCANNCRELGRTAREEQQRHAEMVRVGSQIRAELAQKGVQLKQENKNKLTELQKNKKEAEDILEEKEALKKEIEELESDALEQYKQIEEDQRKAKEELEAAKSRVEAVETFNRFDSNQDGKVEVAEIQTRQEFDKDRNGEVSVEEALFFLNEQEGVNVEEFVTLAWPKIRPFAVLDGNLFKPPAVDGNEEVADLQDEEQVEEQEEEIDEHLDEEEQQADDDDEAAEEQPAEDPAPSTITYDEETQKLVDRANAARKEYEHAQSSVRDVTSDINQIEEYLSKDFGPDEEYATLQGQCFEYTDHEYIYKLCPFDRTAQQPKSSGHETRLGTWYGWEGSEANKYEYMSFTGGQQCWNGPQRTTRVRVSCAGENRVVAVSEPNRCEYFFDFITPAACREQLEHQDALHDEL